jgi:hypothetical protein
MKEPVLVFGAGALSLGFLGPMLARDYELIFCDLEVKHDVLDLLRGAGRYVANICADAIAPLPVTGVGGLNLSLAADNKRAAARLKDVRLVFTAVGSGGIAGTLDFIRRNKGRGELFVFSCENDKRTRERFSGVSADGIVLCETVMGRMCRLDAAGGPYQAIGPGLNQAVVAEDFSGLPVPAEIHRRAGLTGAAWQAMTGREFEARAHLKLYGHNGIHAYLAYLGALEGLMHFHQTGARLRAEAESLLQEEVVPAVLRAYGESLNKAQVEEYASRLVGRATRKTFGDTIERGARNSWDKIAAGERLVEGAQFVLHNGYTPKLFCRTIAAGIKLNRPDDLSPDAVDAVISDHCGIRENELAWLVKKGLEALP